MDSEIKAALDNPANAPGPDVVEQTTFCGLGSPDVFAALLAAGWRVATVAAWVVPQQHSITGRVSMEVNHLATLIRPVPRAYAAQFGLLLQDPLAGLAPVLRVQEWCDYQEAKAAEMAATAPPADPPSRVLVARA